MSRSQPDAKSTTQLNTGFFASRSNLLLGQGISTPSFATPAAQATPVATRGSTGMRSVPGASSTAWGYGVSHRGAPAAKFLCLLAISLIALFVTAAPASAADPSTAMGAISEVSYTTAHVEGKITTDGSGGLGNTAYTFQYSTDQTNWKIGFESGFGTNIVGPAVDQEVKADITLPKGGTEYFVRLVANNGAFRGADTEVTSPEPNPSFTTLAVDPPTIPGAVAASPVFSTSAKANGKVKRPANPANPGPGVDAAFDVKCHFEYITDDQYKANELASAPLFEGATPFPCAQNPITKDTVDPEREQAVTADLTGLSPSTDYHLRLVTENAAPGVVTKEAANFTTAAKVAAPIVVATDDASEVKIFTAEFTGKVLRPDGADPALDVKCHFEYITDAQFLANEGNSEPGFTGASSLDCEQNTIKSVGETTVRAKAGLFANTTYHLRLIAENEGGTDTMVAANTFTTEPAELPTLTIDPVEGGTFTTAHVTGTATLTDGHTSAGLPFLQISSDGGATWSIASRMLYTPTAGPAKGKTFNGTIGLGEEGTVLLEGDLTGLQPSTTYLFRIALSYSNAEEGGYPEAEARGEVAFSPEPNPEITTGELFPPTAEEFEVTAITATSAHFSALVDPHAPVGPLSQAGKKAFATHWEFVCTPECKNANGNPIEGTVQGEEGAQTISGDAIRLDPNTDYEASLIISSEGGGETLGPIPFETPLIPPTVKAFPGASDGKGGYTLQGSVNPNGSNVSDCKFEWGPNSADYAFTAPCSPTPGDKAQPVTVEAHLTGLNPGVVYHYNLLATNGAGTSESGDQEFTPTLNPSESCPNEQLRVENSSLALPECRAYEMVTPPGKEGFSVSISSFSGGGAVSYLSNAGNISKSGQNSVSNRYVATRSATGWETIPNLNGASGSLYDDPSEVETPVTPILYASDLRSSVWVLSRYSAPGEFSPFLRNQDGTFTRIGAESGEATHALVQAVSDDLSHVAMWGDGFNPTSYGSGIYEFVGTGNDQPRRVDVDNLGSPISTCSVGTASGFVSAFGKAMSDDGRVIFFVVPGGCGGGNPPSNELWARIDGTTGIDVSASRCNRTVGDLGGACNGPVGDGACTTSGSTNGFGEESGPGCRGARFEGAASDGSRVFFTTKRQLLNGDTDESTDLYACDIPAGTPAPVDKANHCSALSQVSAGPPSGAAVESVSTVAGDGSAVLFTAKGVLTDNEDAFGELATSGDHNLYLWRTDAAHPGGQTAFVARLNSNDLDGAQATADGRYLAFTTSNQLVPTDTDSARDAYRYDVEARQLTRVSTNVFGVAGNGAGFDAQIGGATEHNPTTAISGDGQRIVFTTAEALSPADGNAEPDVYLWTPTRVHLISTGSVGGGAELISSTGVLAVIDHSGKNIYFSTAGALTPADGDDLADIYDARIGGGFSFAPKPICTGESCQPDASPPPPQKAPGSAQPGPGNPNPPKSCPKGKVRKKNGKCVKKPKKHSGKKHHGKKPGHKQEGGK